MEVNQVPGAIHASVDFSPDLFEREPFALQAPDFLPFCIRIRFISNRAVRPLPSTKGWDIAHLCCGSSA